MESITVEDQTPTGLLHKCIFSVGSPNARSLEFEEISKAFTFELCNSIGGNRKFNVHMASAYYIHNAKFLKELSLCAGDFKQYAYNLAKSLQYAATDMAKNIVTSKKTFVVDEDIGMVDFSSAADEKCSSADKSSKLQFSVCIETPVVIFPKDEDGADLIVGNLGRISCWNSFTTSDSSMLDSSHATFDRLVVEVQKINLSVLNINTENLMNVVKSGLRMADILKKQESDQVHIIHNTNLYLQADQCRSTSRLELHGKINSPLKVFLSMPIYRQILSTLQFASKSSSDELITPSVSTTSIPSVHSAADVSGR